MQANISDSSIDIRPEPPSSDKQQGGNNQRQQLPPQFKIYIIEHLIMHPIRKLLKNSLRSIKKQWLQTYHQELKIGPTTSQYLSPTKYKYQTTKYFTTTEDYPNYQDHKCNYFDNNYPSKGQSPFQRKRGTPIGYNSHLNNHTGIHTQLYSNGLSSPNHYSTTYSELYLGKKSPGQQVKPTSYLHSQAHFPSVDIPTQLIDYSSPSRCLSNTYSQASSSSSNKQSTHRKHIRSFVKLIFIIINRTLNNSLSLCLQRLKGSNQNDSTMHNMSSASQLSQIQHLYTIRTKLVDELNDLNDELLIKRQDLQLVRRNIDTLKSNQINYSKQSAKNQMESSYENTEFSSQKQHKFSYNEDDEDAEQRVSQKSMQSTSIRNIQTNIPQSHIKEGKSKHTSRQQSPPPDSAT